jgi:hypothetical protein
VQLHLLVVCDDQLTVLLLLLLLLPAAVVLCEQPENFEKHGYTLPRAVRAWPPRENGKYDVIGQLPPVKQLPSTTAMAAASSS